MATDRESTFVRIAGGIGKGLLFLARRVFLLLAAFARFFVLRAIPAAWRWLRGTALPALHRFYLWLPHRRLVVGIAACAIVVSIAMLVLLRTPGPGPDAPMATRGDPAAPPAASPDPPAAEPAVLIFEPARAAPGSLLVLRGAPLAAGEAFEVVIGGQPTTAQRQPDGSIRALVPLFPGGDGWPVPPAETQSVEVRRQGVPLVTSEQRLAVEPLPRAPGTTAAMQRSLERIVAGYERIFESLPVQHEEERAYRRAVLAALRGLVSEGDHSLAAVLAGTSPLLQGSGVDLDLADALFASSGSAAYLEAYAEAMDGGPKATTAWLSLGSLSGGRGAIGTANLVPGPIVAAALAAAAVPDGAPTPIGDTYSLGAMAGGVQCRQRGADFELACMMQVQGLLTDYSQGFVKPTADTYANTVGLAASYLGVFGQEFPAHLAVSILLTVANFVMDKIAPSLFPASLTRFELHKGKRLLQIDETLPARVTVEARNHPQTVTMLDLLDLVKGVAGPFVRFEDQYRSHLKAVFEFTLDMYLYVLKQTGTVQHIDANAFTLPSMRWGPTDVTSQDLVDLFSYDAHIVSVVKDQMQWRADSSGQTSVRVMPRGPGERSKILVDNTLCQGCVWSGGAFGTDMPAETRPVAVGVELKAHPPQGKAPLDVVLRWDIAKQTGERDPVPCTVDFGDGSSPERIADCSETSSIEHTYPYTSRLEADTGGAYLATLSMGGEEPEGTAEVFTDWTFRGSPETGEAPVEARFAWDIPWPEDRNAPGCEFDPGDGSGRQRFDDCLAVTEVEHTFEKRGSFVPALTIIDGGARDTKTAPVSVAEEGTCDAELTRHKRWTGTVSYSQTRDAWNERGDAHVRYRMNIRLGADMQERTRREFRGAEYVQYYSPLPQGSGSMDYTFHGYGPDGKLDGSDTFTGTGPMQRQEKHMSEDGSMLTLIIDAHTCTYKFHLQGQSLGSGERWNWRDGSEAYDGHMWINSVWGQGVLESSGAIRGTRSFPVLSRSRIEDNGFETTDWVSEYDSVSSYLGEDNLGTVTVSWDFRPLD